MTAEPQVWHYGLVAEIWARFLVDTPELPYYQKQIERYGQPVLDLACGTGRLLLPLLRAGVDIDGADISADMLGLCRQRAAGEGFEAQLYEQAMHRLDLPRRYRTIYICGSFGLAGSRQLDQETLGRCYHHLEPDGVLILNIDAEYAYPDAWRYWLKEGREALPEPWPEEGERRQDPNGTVYVSRSRMLAVDPLEQSFERQMQVELWRGSQLLGKEERTLRGNMYFKNELALMLERAGFGHIAVQGDYTEEMATADHSELVFIAQKVPGAVQ